MNKQIETQPETQPETQTKTQTETQTEKQTEAQTKTQNQIHVWLKLLFEIISVTVAIFTFILDVFPDINVFSSNYEKKAQAGHSASQIFLAHYYYEICDYEQSIYWYKLASAKGKYCAEANNNLAVLYGLTEEKRVDKTVEDFEQQKFDCLVESALQGNKTGIKNLCNFLQKRNLDYYIDKNEPKRKDVEQIVCDYMGITNFSEYMPQYVYKGTIKTENQMLCTTSEVVYKLKSTQRELIPNSFKYVTYRYYDVYEQDTDTQLEALEYDFSVKKIK